MAHITPLVLREKYFQAIEKEVQRLFNILIYAPLVDILNKDNPYEITNSLTSLIEAIRNGTVWYEDGLFKGQFTAKISIALRGLGAAFNSLTRTWSLPLELLPDDIRIAQADVNDHMTKVRERMISALDNVHLDNVDKLSTTPIQYRKTLDEMQKDFLSAAHAITVLPELTDSMRDIIAKEWGQNLDLYIKKWTGENIIKLREDIQANAFKGGRAESLVKMIQDNYGTSKSKAKFLARQETSLLMSKFQQTRYADIGITRYRWSTSHDERVRPDHAKLNGKVYSFDSPPVTCSKTGARNNPGEDFNCRCIAVPIVE